MSISIYNFLDYRDYIEAKVKAETDSWGIWKRLAKAAGCQPTYLSQAIRRKVHLTSDQVFGISRFWALSDRETDFFLLLHEHAKAGVEDYKRRLAGKIRQMQADQENISKRFKVDRLDSPREVLYYSAWFWQALHVIVSIPSYRTAAAIAERLNLPPTFVENCLETLQAQDIVVKKGAEWHLGTRDIHLPSDSPLIGVYHNHWRNRAVTASTIPGNDGVHFSSVYSISETDFTRLKTKVLELVEESRRIVSPSKEEEIICLNCDLFRI